MTDLVKELTNSSALVLETWYQTVCSNCMRHQVHDGPCETCPYRAIYKQVADVKYRKDK